MTNPSNNPHLQHVIKQQSYPLLFVTISGAHLYGFPSPDSDYDLRGVHTLPVEEVIGLNQAKETIEYSGIHDNLEIDTVTHDVKKFFIMLLKRNGYVLEQLFSPLILLTTEHHEELKAIMRTCITVHHAHHYLGFARNQWKQFIGGDEHRVKSLLYVYRVLLTGIYLMQTGVVEANLVNLNETFDLPYIPDLIDRKMQGAEKDVLQDADLEFHQREYDGLTIQLETARDNSSLPSQPACKDALHDLLLRLRLVKSD